MFSTSALRKLSNNELYNQYQSLVFDATALEQEKYKLAILKQLDTNFDKLTRNFPLKKKPKKKPKNSYLRSFAYYFLLIFSFFESAIGGFLGIQEIVALIPYITEPWLIALSIIITAIECILFYAFEITFLRTALKIEIPYDENRELKNTYREQVEIVASLNQKIFNIRNLTMLTNEEYEAARLLLIAANAAMLDLKKNTTKYIEPLNKKVLRWFVIGFGALMAVGNTYFIGTALLIYISPALMGFPLGWVFLGFMVVARLSLFFYTRGNSMMGLINPEYESEKQLRKQLKTFEPMESLDFTIANECFVQKAFSIIPADMNVQEPFLDSAKLISPEILEQNGSLDNDDDSSDAIALFP